MNSRERIITTLEHGKADRVPLAEMWIDSSIVASIIDGNDGNDLAEHLDTDMVTVATMVYAEDEVEWVDKDREMPIFRDKWGTLQTLTHDAIPVPTEPARIETPEDLAAYTPPDPAKSPVLDKIRRLKAKYPNGEKAIAIIGESGWAPAVFLRGGLANLLLDFALRPDFVKDVMKIGTEYYSELFPMALAAGADICFMGDDYSDKNGPMMSPAQFEEIILPCDAQVVSVIKKAGGYCVKHTDGNIQKIIDGLISTGLDCLGPLEDVPQMELDKILDKYPGKISVMGNISVDLLSRGTQEEVIAATKYLLATVSSKGSHIMSSGNTIANSVNPENFLAMVNTTKEFGCYPIDVEGLKADLESGN
jgi:uroporphyrinogen decarboxylase